MGEGGVGQVASRLAHLCFPGGGQQDMEPAHCVAEVAPEHFPVLDTALRAQNPAFRAHSISGPPVLPARPLKTIHLKKKALGWVLGFM